MKKDKNNQENEISAVLVVPRNVKFYDYYINGTPDMHTMKRNELLKFCTSLCPDWSSSIRRCIFELKAFIIYPQENKFNELKENDPPRLNKKDILFSNAKKIKYANMNDKKLTVYDLYKTISKDYSLTNY